MRGTLARYLRRRVGTRILALLLLIVAVVQVLELLDVTTDILNRDLGFGGIVYYGMLRTPSQVVFALPLAALLGTMLSLSDMARSLEIASMRTAGISLTRMFVLLLPMLVALALAQFALSQEVVPRAETRLKAWWDETAIDGAHAEPRWTRTDTGPVSIGAASPNGTELTTVGVYVRNSEGLLTARWVAGRARWAGGSWTLTDVTELRLSPDGGISREKIAGREWKTNLRPEDVVLIDDARPQLSSTMLAEIIAGARVGTQPRSYYLTVLYRSFTAPFGLIIMSLLALPTACATARGGNAREIVVSLVLGLGFLLSDGIAASLGTSGQLSSLMTVLMAPASFIVIGVLRTRACERI